MHREFGWLVLLMMASVSMSLLTGPVGAITYEELVLSDGPIAYYRFNDRPLDDVLDPNDFPPPNIPAETPFAEIYAARLPDRNDPLVRAENLGSLGTDGSYSFSLVNVGPDGRPGVLTSVPSLLPHDFGDGDTAMNFELARMNSNLNAELNVMSQTGSWEAWLQHDGAGPPQLTRPQVYFARYGSNNPPGFGDQDPNDPSTLGPQALGRVFLMHGNFGVDCFRAGVPTNAALNCYGVETHPFFEVFDDPNTAFNEATPGFTGICDDGDPLRLCAFEALTATGPSNPFYVGDPNNPPRLATDPSSPHFSGNSVDPRGHGARHDRLAR